MFKIQKLLLKCILLFIIIILPSIITCTKSVDIDSHKARRKTLSEENPITAFKFKDTEHTLARASLGDTWTRPSDNMVMTYVPAGKFIMGTDEESFNVALRLCHRYFGGNEVFIPALDRGGTIATIETWDVAEENDIKQGDVIGSIRTRANDIIDIVSDHNGEIARLAKVGQEVSASKPIALIGENCDFEWFQDESLFTEDVGRAGFVVQLDAFWIDKTEITNAQYRKCVAAGVCEPPTDNASDTRMAYYGDIAYDNYPVVNIPWDQAKTYCEWTSAQLPTEAQWEYASRGPEARLFPWGDTFNGNLLNYCDANCPGIWADDTVDDGYTDTAPVGSFPKGASWCGALDMAGNVWEWVADFYMPYHMMLDQDRDYSSLPLLNPIGASYGQFGSGSFKILKGGAAISRPDDVRGAGRNTLRPGFMDGMIGFRCVISEQMRPKLMEGSDDRI